MGALKLKKALLIVDVQNDFCPGGALGVRDGDSIIPMLNKYIKEFSFKKLPVLVTRDWHPAVTKHFKKWPRHCVQGTKGAAFHPKLKIPKEAIILSKGMDPEQDSYSAFHSIDANGTVFRNLLHILGVTEIFVGGLATDYCVKFTTLDALKAGLRVHVLADAVKGVNIKPRDSERAMTEMIAHGAQLRTFDKLKK